MQVPGGEAEPDSVHRAITEGQLDVDPTQDAIVVHYQMNAVVVSVFGDPMVADRKDCRKLIKVPNLGPTTNIQALAWNIVSKCDIINTSRLPEVEQLLAYLQNRNKGKGGDKDVLESSSRQIREQIEDMQNATENATMAELDSYLEGLYDDMQAKIRGTGLILQLARSPDNLCVLIENESLFLALARVLKEDWKKSIELSTNIVYIFFCFSTFSMFHKMLAQHKIGSTCMTVVEHEIKRFNSLTDDLTEKKKICKNEDATAAAKAKKEYERAKKKYQQLIMKQETLLRVALYLLLNLSEDTNVELKMRNKGLIPHLTTLLERSNQELLILVISFLKKLSIYVENKDDMAKQDIIKKLNKVIPCDNEILVNVALRLLLNLSFDPALRHEIVKMGLLPKLSSLLKDESHRVVVLCILYHISMDTKSRSMFSYTDCIPELMRLILDCSEELVDPETIALGINLSCSPRNVQIMCNGPGLKLLIRRALKSRDSLLLKMIRNISRCQGDIKKLFLPFLSELCEVVKKGDQEGEEEVCVEVLGILGNLSLPEVDFHKVVTELDLLPFILSKLKGVSVQDDLLLQVVILCGTLALDDKCAILLVDAGVPDLLITILKAKQEDDEMVLQIVYLFYHLVLHKATRQKVAKQSLAPDYLLELMNDKNKEVCKLCSKTLDIIVECDPELALKIKHERFRWHNFQWLEMVTGETMYAEGEEEDEDYLDPHYLHTAAELYDMRDGMGQNFGTMGMGGHPAEMLDAFPGVGHPAEMEFEYGRNFDPFDDEIKSYHTNPFGGAMSPDFPASQGHHPAATNRPTGGVGLPGGSTGPLNFGDMEETSDRPEVLSPHQYAMLMSSMQDPLALYSSSLGASTSSNLDPQQRQNPVAKDEFDPLEMYSAQGYSISPTTYGVTGGRGSLGGKGEEFGGGPMFRTSTMFQPRPPAAPRNQPSRR